jgi:hypothetical protein
MRHLVTAALLLAGIVHLLPVAGVLGGPRLAALYGVQVADPNLDLLLRHRAVLFALLGLLLCAAAFRPVLQAPALIAGLASLVSFLSLAAMGGGLNPQLSRVFAVDVAALAVLGAGGIAWLRNPA